MKKFILVSCSKSKLDGVQFAKDIYEPSPIFQKRRQFARDRGVGWGILSAKYGYLNPWDHIETYDMHIKEREGIIWGALLKKKLLKRLSYENVDEVIILAGQKYITPIKPFLAENGYEVTNYNKGLQSGERLRELKEANAVGSQSALDEY